MTTSARDRETGDRTYADTREAGLTLSLLLTLEDARKENAAIDAEDILVQAEEANALDPVG